MNEISKETIDQVNGLLHEFLNKLYHNLGEFSEELSSFNPIDLQLIELIGKKPKIIVKQAKDQLNARASTLTSAINRLEKKEIITRVICENDKRSYGLMLTDKGQEINSHHKALDFEVVSKILAAFDGSEEQEKLISVLSILCKTF